jgi:hypothetical protein
MFRNKKQKFYRSRTRRIHYSALERKHLFDWQKRQEDLVREEKQRRSESIVNDIVMNSWKCQLNCNACGVSAKSVFSLEHLPWWKTQFFVSPQFPFGHQDQARSTIVDEPVGQITELLCCGNARYDG